MVAPSQEAAGFAVIGDTVNTAARLGDLATAGHVLVDPTTRERTRRAIRYGQRRERAVKNKAEPLVTFEALGVARRSPSLPRGRLRRPRGHARAARPRARAGRARRAQPRAGGHRRAGDRQEPARTGARTVAAAPPSVVRPLRAVRRPTRPFRVGRCRGGGRGRRGRRRVGRGHSAGDRPGGASDRAAGSTRRRWPPTSARCSRWRTTRRGASGTRPARLASCWRTSHDRGPSPSCSTTSSGQTRRSSRCSSPRIASRGRSRSCCSDCRGNGSRACPPHRCPVSTPGRCVRWPRRSSGRTARARRGRRRADRPRQWERAVPRGDGRHVARDGLDRGPADDPPADRGAARRAAPRAEAAAAGRVGLRQRHVGRVARCDQRHAEHARDAARAGGARPVASASEELDRRGPRVRVATRADPRRGVRGPAQDGARGTARRDRGVAAAGVGRARGAARFDRAPLRVGMGAVGVQDGPRPRPRVGGSGGRVPDAVGRADVRPAGARGRADLPARAAHHRRGGARRGPADGGACLARACGGADRDGLPR